MDPQATLEMINDAITETDITRARELIEDLDEWINRGGFVPAGYAETLSRYATLALEVERMITR